MTADVEPGSEAESLFELDDNLFVPTALSRGPWSPDSLHGGPVAALAADGLVAEMSEGFRSARFGTVFLKPVPQLPLRLDVVPVRRGGQIEVLEGLLSVPKAGGAAVVARSLLVAVRAESEMVSPDEAVDLPDGYASLGLSLTDRSFLGDAMDVRYVVGSAALEPQGWFRLRVPILPDRPIHPLVRLAAAADLCGGTAMRRGRVMLKSLINLDINVEVVRDPVGEWLTLRARSDWGSAGFGHARADVADQHGPVGMTSSAVVEQPDSKFEGWSPRVWTAHPQRMPAES